MTPRQIVFNVEEINEIQRKLLALKHNPQICDYGHIKNILKTQADIANNICPRCGNAMLLRSGQYSSFYGCSGYPKCKFKKPNL
jgi:predicted RNA-binding Zn-ribbon protein involved in translation (DUF1610 family)